MNRLKVFLCDDHKIIADGFALLFDRHPQFELVGYTHRGKELLQKIKELNPDILLLDLNLEDTDGLSLLQQIREINSTIKILILTMYQDAFLITQAQKYGANGYLEKSVSGKELIEALNLVAGGNFYLSKRLLFKSEKRNLYRDQFVNKMKLTKREIEIIPYLASGASNSQISEKLFVSPFTIDTHRKNIFRKLEINNIVELVNFAHANNIL
ncbi:MAG: response regulator transcription factor [Cyclobacteriaceae bacterium]|nr:response regulator transcription factor [Cyclobacteriaceae bacterium]